MINILIDNKNNKSSTVSSCAVECLDVTYLLKAYVPSVHQLPAYWKDIHSARFENSTTFIVDYDIFTECCSNIQFSFGKVPWSLEGFKFYCPGLSILFERHRSLQ